ncbi:MAG: carbohydrate kinase [Muribaculaceae bacterium]|nr:carbohydrate kinase [Muribaculaceae bacterium]
MYLLGYDIGSSSVKGSLVDAQSGQCMAQAFYPPHEAPIDAPQRGWAEQNPADWWNYTRIVTEQLLQQAHVTGSDIAAIGISYQMHGLVCVDERQQVLRPSIIWCDSRAVPHGNEAYDALGEDYCLSHLLNSPGNFTAAKLAWVKHNEPAIFERIHKVMLPGEYIAMRLSGTIATTVSGLSEGIFWDFQRGDVSQELLDHFGFSRDLLADVKPTFGLQGEVNEQAAAELGLAPGTPITYRAGDQPNNALSLNVLRPGEIASTAGTSGVVYGVLGEVNHDPLSRVNPFAHVNHTAQAPRLGVLLCINGTGILNSWMKRSVADAGMKYAQMNEVAAQAPVGCERLSIIPFGNGAERMLENRDTGCSIVGLDFNHHGKAHLLRAAQEGIVFSFKYGIEIMQQMGMNVSRIRAGHTNMFLSPLFRTTLASITGAPIELYDTDGSVGAARGAGIGVGIYRTADEAFASLNRIAVVEPDVQHSQQYQEAYELWKTRLQHILSEKI